MQRATAFLITCSTGFVLVAGCAHRSHPQPAAPIAAYKPTATRPCAQARAVVVDNESGYAIHVGSTDAAPSFGRVDNLGTVQNGRVDTLKFLSGGHGRLLVRDDRPPLPSGALQQIRDVGLWCIG